jgi:UDP-4-amino-4-deoxy-L-arabinose formyltransferase/UDP-glucuronic acid dehydrogenase (UDP-4-keto-hexauronic acid decarboxylating)
VNAVAFAYSDMGITGLNALEAAGFGIRAIFSHEDDPGENIWFGSVRTWGEERGIPVLCPESVSTSEWRERIADLKTEALFSFYYRHMICGEILDLAPAGAYNLHGSLLPAYRGRAPVNWVLVNGEARTGITLHHMVAKPDAGDIVGQRAVDIAFEDTALTLYRKLCRAATDLLAEVLPLIAAGTAPRIPMDLSRGSYFGGRKPADGLIDWHRPARRIYDLVRAVTDPWPGAFTFLPTGEKLVVWRGLPVASGTGGPALPMISSSGAATEPGDIRLGGDRVFVTTGDGLLELLEIEMEGRRMEGASVRDRLRPLEGCRLVQGTA